MLGGSILIVLLLCFIWLTVVNALQLFWPWILVVLLASMLLWLVVKLMKSVAIQNITTGLTVGGVFLVMIATIPPHLATVLCAAVVSLTLFVAAVMANASQGKDKVVKVASAQLLWLIPLTLTVYTYSFVDPAAVVAPVAVLLLGAIVAIPASAV